MLDPLGGYTKKTPLEEGTVSAPPLVLTYSPRGGSVVDRHSPDAVPCPQNR